VTAHTGTLTAALVLDGVRAMSPAERNELRELLKLDADAVDREKCWMESGAAAVYLGMHRDTLRKLAAASVIPSEQDGPGRKRYFSKAALDHWRESGGRFHAASIPPKNTVDAGGSR
jgi:excisionase family DNA binding protein